MAQGTGQRTARIQDVARAAGVSTATVSRALSKPDLLSETTREAVFEAIRLTGYRVNQSARNLRRQRAGAVLVLVPNLGNPFFSQILSGLSEVFAASEYSVLIQDTNHLARQDGLLDFFLDQRIDGMISLDGSLSVGTLDLMARNAVSDRILCACEWVAGVDLPSVRSDNHKGATLAMRHLYDLGHRRIAHVTGPVQNVLTQVRRDAVLAARAELDLPARPEWIVRGDFSLASGRAAAERLLAMSANDRPSAVFCASDETALGLIAGLHAAGVQVPDDMSVVGFDDIDLAEYAIPALTTIRQDRQTLGRRAAERLLNRLDGGPLRAADTVDLVDVSLVVRDSTRAI
ncbi:LacI family DNA-binding transcriptional regulator [Sagittula salina]|uniref:LacI family DNA-binding transcriptional regulator n=1 Tax=Sagittula salina TaxID=2820268 RepID=A0A940MJT2_9RHOB|nr:LacI family DNA-binding transcriptional regulator [Sagittula salina]MBP0482816.1 LacI family DNA-binding transcriptional regulator [Sagittula salina]